MTEHKPEYATFSETQVAKFRDYGPAPATDVECERRITFAEARALLPISIERGGEAHYALHFDGKTLFINSESPIEFAVPKER